MGNEALVLRLWLYAPSSLLLPGFHDYLSPLDTPQLGLSTLDAIVGRPLFVDLPGTLSIPKHWTFSFFPFFHMHICAIIMHTIYYFSFSFSTCYINSGLDFDLAPRYPCIPILFPCTLLPLYLLYLISASYFYFLLSALPHLFRHSLPMLGSVCP